MAFNFVDDIDSTTLGSNLFSKVSVITILVIGGPGFVGAYLTNLLVGKGYEVTIMSRHPQVGTHFGSSVIFSPLIA